MLQANINYLAVFVSAVVYMVIGALWYSPVLFGKTWKKLVCQHQDNLRGNAANGYALTFVAALLIAYVLAHFVDYLGADTALAGAQTAFWLWAGFSVTTGIGETIFAGRSGKLYVLNMTYNLVAMVVMGAIIAVWV